MTGFTNQNLRKDTRRRRRSRLKIRQPRTALRSPHFPSTPSKSLLPSPSHPLASPLLATACSVQHVSHASTTTTSRSPSTHSSPNLPNNHSAKPSPLFDLHNTIESTILSTLSSSLSKAKILRNPWSLSQ
ncbi:hypothetical protein BLNAU_7084 [Blattamonas nauphoetae]|uniref:Uncharacterized protein n=1 Tax=Blattamonas nauphoetae TaxID=2049346 RepID=A0ABQ9Y2J5_9EUKA|nr:hypothetical protein BLNAU_7084 [Blattamonas nauphoetae]